MGVVPLALQAALELLPALGARFGGHPLWRSYGARAAALLDANKVTGLAGLPGGWSPGLAVEHAQRAQRRLCVVSPRGSLACLGLQ
jgi:hypothetical protein